MIINEIKISRKFNLGNFEMLDVSLSATPTKEETENKTTQEIINNVSKELFLRMEEIRVENGKKE